MINIQNLNLNHFFLVTIIILITAPCSQCSIKPLNTTCLCDVTDTCDYQCCCDSQCTASLITILYRYNRCGNNNFGIPLCSTVNITDTHVDDLYSGLKTIYTVIKRLFCVSRVNIVDPTTFYNKTSSDTVINDAITTVKSSISAATLLPDNIASLGQSSITGIMFRSQLGICSITNKIQNNLGTNGLQQCRTLLSSTNISSHQYLSIESFVANFPNIRIFSLSDSTSISANPLPSNTTTTCSNGNCFNVVKFVKFYIKPDTNVVNQTLSYIVVGDALANTLPGYYNIKYDYLYLNSDSSFANASNVGYKIGTYLQLMKSNMTSASTFSYFKISNPINLAFRKPNGDCRTSTTDPTDQSIIQLKLGRNQFHTCIGDNSMILNNLKNMFDMVGVIGSANTKISDFISVSWPASNNLIDPSNVIFTVYFVKIGTMQNPQYYILKIIVQGVANSVSASKQKTLFIEYQEVSSTASTYLPPAPKVDAYLPNDFLYPFYVAQ